MTDMGEDKSSGTANPFMPSPEDVLTFWFHEIAPSRWWAVDEGGSWLGYFSRICVMRCWSDVYASGSVSAQAYVLMWCPAFRRASRPVAVPP